MAAEFYLLLCCHNTEINKLTNILENIKKQKKSNLNLIAYVDSSKSELIDILAKYEKSLNIKCILGSSKTKLTTKECEELMLQHVKPSSYSLFVNAESSKVVDLWEPSEDEWKLTNIPKIAYAYWGGTVLPYLHYLTLYSFCKYNPDWKVILYTPKVLEEKKQWDTYENKHTLDGVKNYWPDAKKLPIEISTFDMKKLNRPNTMSEIFKSDIIRMYLLSTYGGFWIDMDILFLKPMSDMYFNTKYNKDLKSVICIHDIYPLQAFQGCMPGDQIYKDIYKLIETVKETKDYNGFGTTLFMDHFSIDKIHKKYDRNSYVNMTLDVAFSYFGSNMYELSVKGGKNLITDDTIGVHLYAGHPKMGELIKKVTHENYLEFDNQCCKFVAKLLKDTSRSKYKYWNRVGIFNESKS